MRSDQLQIEGEFRRNDGVAVIDNFLTEEAICQLRSFCQSSTVWFANRYGHGRLGAFLRSGFNTPILWQIAKEVREILGGVLAEQHLKQVWAFKYDERQPRTSPHADFAAINVNLWITPEAANMDRAEGGLTIYRARAPEGWTFDQYNRQGAMISGWLERRAAESIDIPYRENRAVIFDSSLFHVTQPVRFRGGYANRRVNVTWLFGSRS